MDFVVQDLFCLIHSDVVLAEKLRDALGIQINLVGIRTEAIRWAIVPFVPSPYSSATFMVYGLNLGWWLYGGRADMRYSP